MRQLTWFVQGGLSTPPHPTSKLRKECRKKRKRRVEIEGFFGPFSKATFKGALLKDPTVYYNSPPGRKADELLHSNTMQGNCFLLLLSSCSGITGLVASQNKTTPESETIQHIPKLFILRCAVPMRRSKMKELDVWASGVESLRVQNTKSLHQHSDTSSSSEHNKQVHPPLVPVQSSKLLLCLWLILCAIARKRDETCEQSS